MKERKHFHFKYSVDENNSFLNRVFLNVDDVDFLHDKLSRWGNLFELISFYSDGEFDRESIEGCDLDYCFFEERKEIVVAEESFFSDYNTIGKLFIPYHKILTRSEINKYSSLKRTFDRFFSEFSDVHAFSKVGYSYEPFNHDIMVVLNKSQL